MKVQGARFAVRAALLFAGLAAAACDGAPEAPSPSDSAGGAAEPSAERNLQRFPADELTRAGVEIAAAAPSRRDPEVEAFGRVLDPAAVVQAVADREASRAAADAGRRELDRLEALARDDQNASARELEAARAVAARARGDRDGADARLVGLLGVGSQAGLDLGSLARQLGRHESALVRVDAPAGGIRPEPERGARLAAYTDPNAVIEARYLGAASDSDPALPGWGFLFLVTRDPPPTGAPVLAWLRTSGPSLSGVRVPAASLVQDAGGTFVFVERSAGTFERRAVQAEPLPDGGWFLSAGLAEGERIAVSGAQALLSAERLGAGGAREND